jgi:hypothetical protein
MRGETAKAGMTREGTLRTRARRRGTARSHNTRRSELLATHAGRVQAHRQRCRGSLVERVVVEKSGKEKEGGELVVGRRKVVRRSCVVEEEARAKSWTKSPRDSETGRVHRRRPRRKAL